MAAVDDRDAAKLKEWRDPQGLAYLVGIELLTLHLPVHAPLLHLTTVG